MNMLLPFMCLLCVHWIADFVLQTPWQASNKSKNNVALSRHVATYTACLMLGTFILPFSSLGDRIGFAVLNGLLHFITDYFTSRQTARLHAAQDWHNFFVLIGFDQLIHQCTLGSTMWWLLT